MPRTTSCAMALSVNCDSTPENLAKFRDIFEGAVRKLRALDGYDRHGNSNAQFYGGQDFTDGDLYLHEDDVEDTTQAEAVSKSSTKSAPIRV